MLKELEIFKGSKNSKIDFMIELIEEFLYKNERISDKRWEKKDVTYWYNERTLLGLLAGTIWQNGGIVLEEYSSVKEERGEKYAGRTDFYFEIGFAKDNLKCIIEAKWLYPILAFNNHEDNFNKIKVTHEEALNNCLQSYDKTVNYHFAMTFVLPKISKSKKDEMSKLISDHASMIKDHKICDQLYCWFPEAFRNFPDKKYYPTYNYYYPGLIILLSQYVLE
ncbi:hypothetical protein ACFL6I_14140 [candidate division KSB1 bacterium]